MSTSDVDMLEQQAYHLNMAASDGKSTESAGLPLAAEAYELLRRAIIECELPPGAEITESGLTVRFGLGKAAVRVALARLHQEELVTPMPRRGHRIAPITMRRVLDTFALRTLLEAEAARLACGRADIERMREMDSVCAGGYDPADRTSIARYLAANADLHVEVARGSGNERLTRMLRQLLDDTERILHLAVRIHPNSVEIHHDHTELIEVLTGDSPEHAASVSAAQVAAGQKVVIDAFHRAPQLMSIGIEIDA